MLAAWLAVAAAVVAAGGEGQWQLDDACVVWDGDFRGSPGVPAFFSRQSRRRLIPSPLFYTERGHVWVRPGESTGMIDAGGDGDGGCRVDSRIAFVAMLSNPVNLFHAMHHAVPIAEALNGGSLPLALARARTPMVLLPWANDLAADEIARHLNRRGVSPKLKDWVGYGLVLELQLQAQLQQQSQSLQHPGHPHWRNESNSINVTVDKFKHTEAIRQLMQEQLELTDPARCVCFRAIIGGHSAFDIADLPRHPNGAPSAPTRTDSESESGRGHRQLKPTGEHLNLNSTGSRVQNFRHVLRLQAGPADTIVFVLRGGPPPGGVSSEYDADKRVSTGDRIIINENALRMGLRSVAGFEVIYVQLEQLTLREQMEVVAGARLLVGVHGQGLVWTTMLQTEKARCALV